MSRQSAPIILAVVMVLIALTAIVYIVRTQRYHTQYVVAATPDLAQAVYADRDIADEHVITPEDVVELPIQPADIFPGAMPCQDLVVGSKAKHAIAFRQVVNGKDLQGSNGKMLIDSSDQTRITPADRTTICHHSHGNLINQDPTRTFVIVEDLKEGAIITTKLLLERPDSDAPDDAAHNMWQIVGRPSKYGLFEGNIASEFDSDHASKIPVTVLVTTRDIARGESIAGSDVRSVSLAAVKCPGTALTSTDLLAGCHAHLDIPSGTILRAFHLDVTGAGSH